MRLSVSALAAVVLPALLGCTDSSPAGEIVLPLFVTANQSQEFGTVLAGHKERPSPVDTRARGSAVLSLEEDGSAIRYRLITANIRNVTQAHIHIGPPDGAGPFVVFLFGPSPGDGVMNGVLAEGTFHESDLVERPQIGFGGTMAELIEAMRGGNAYVNVHTVQWPAGEIRGQVEEHGPSR